MTFFPFLSPVHSRFLFRTAFLCAAIVFLAPPSLPAFTSADADTILEAYKDAFYEEKSQRGYFKNTEKKGVTYFWGQAEEIEGIIDAYERTQSPEHKRWVIRLLEGFSSHEGQNWASNKFNDDIMWACIAYARAYLLTGNKDFRKISKENFDLVWERGWDEKGGGGIWWTTEKTGKNSCVVFPAAIAAHLLYQCFEDPKYLAKSQQIYDWGKAHLWNPATGQVYDSAGSHVPTTYNQGTFVGAADFLGDIKSATLVCTYTMERMGSPTWNGYRLMPQYGIDQNNSGFNAIGLRWIAKFVVKHKLEGTFLGWLQTNANAAWDVRRKKDNLSWCQWRELSPNDLVFFSWDCISSVVALQVIPPDILPAAPADVTAANTEDGALVHWSAKSGYAKGYQIKRSTAKGGPYLTIASQVRALSYEDIEVEADATYYYVVSAVTDAGEGPDSPPVFPSGTAEPPEEKKREPDSGGSDSTSSQPKGGALKMPEGHDFETKPPEETPAPETSTEGTGKPTEGETATPENPAKKPPVTEVEEAKPDGEIELIPEETPPSKPSP
jgi:hypothetical protein